MFGRSLQNFLVNVTIFSLKDLEEIFLKISKFLVWGSLKIYSQKFHNFFIEGPKFFALRFFRKLFLKNSESPWKIYSLNSPFFVMMVLWKIFLKMSQFLLRRSLKKKIILKTSRFLVWRSPNHFSLKFYDFLENSIISTLKFFGRIFLQNPRLLFRRSF